MKAVLLVIFVLGCLHESVAPPPRRSDKKEEIRENSETVGMEEFGIEYERYLREVIDVLESDPDFKRKLEQAEETDIRTGKIAHELSYVDHNVRSKLDEVKRAELERLRHLAQKQYELSNGIDVDHMKIMPPEHLDHGNPHTFEIEDLKKLIHKVTYDLNEADKKRREDFKEYEMQKEFENQEKLKHLEGVEKEQFEKQLKENETKHKQHEPLHHPGSKQQLEEVWEKQDKMQQEFNPKVFFQLHGKKLAEKVWESLSKLWRYIKAMHGIRKNMSVLKEAVSDIDLSFMKHVDGNGYWDQNEVKALFIKELDKMYQAGAPEDDMRERAEELERMREHVFRETDRNGDQLISYEEFLEQTKKPEFEKDPSWETIDQQPVYTHEEYAEFERRRMEEIQHLINQGLIPPQPVYHVPPGYHHPGMQQQYPGQHGQQQFNPSHPQMAGHQQFQAQQFANQQGYHPNGQFGNQQGQHPNGQFGNQQGQHPSVQFANQQGLHPNAQYQQQPFQQPQGSHGQPIQNYPQPPSASQHAQQQHHPNPNHPPPVPQAHPPQPSVQQYQQQQFQQPQGSHGQPIQNYPQPPSPGQANQNYPQPPSPGQQAQQQHHPNPNHPPPVPQEHPSQPSVQQLQQQQHQFNQNDNKPQPPMGDTGHGQAPSSQNQNIHPPADTHPNSIDGGSHKTSDQGKSG